MKSKSVFAARNSTVQKAVSRASRGRVTYSVSSVIRSYVFEGNTGKVRLQQTKTVDRPLTIHVCEWRDLMERMYTNSSFLSHFNSFTSRVERINSDRLCKLVRAGVVRSGR